MSSPIRITAGFLPSMMSMAEFRAWIMFMLAMRSAEFLAQQGLLTQQILRHVLEHVLEHRVWIQPRPLGHGAELDCFLPARYHQRLELRAHRLVPLFRPLADFDQMPLQALDGIAHRPVLAVILAPIPRPISPPGTHTPALPPNLSHTSPA